MLPPGTEAIFFSVLYASDKPREGYHFCILLEKFPSFEVISPLFLGEDDVEALKAKNIKQTELVADLREAILQVARHFQCVDPKSFSIVSGRERGSPWAEEFDSICVISCEWVV